MPDNKIIAVVDDDESVRESLPDLLESFGFRTRAFSSAAAFLRFDGSEPIGCLVLDVAMPEMTGPELQQELIRRKRNIPIVFITAHSHDGVWPALLNSGAVACLVKPFSESAIVSAVRTALAPDTGISR
jgi:FixJ family two-component response regulator